MLSSKTVRRVLPAGVVAATLVVLPTTTLPNWGAAAGSGPTARTVVTRQALAKVPKVGLGQAGGESAIRPNAEPVKPGTPAPGQPDDVVADVALGGDMVALTWPVATAPQRVDLLLRTMGPSGWSEWKHIAPSGDADQVDGVGRGTRMGTDPLWLPGTSRVQVRAPRASRADLDSAELTLITPDRTPTPSTVAPAGSAVAAPVSPVIISRAAWGADENLRGGCYPDTAATTKAAVVHHTADSNTYAATDSAAIVRSILAYHTQNLGWCDIGYNALVDKYGQTFEGRIGGLKNPMIGAHALGFNNMTFGVSILGNYETATLPTAGRNALTTILAMRLHDFYVNPAATTQLTSGDSGSRYPAGTTVTLPVITGHRDTFATACPGANVYSLLSQVRQETAAKVTYSDSAIYQRWQALGGAGGDLGLVAVGETRVATGYRTGFQGGKAVYSTSAGTALLGAGFDVYWAQNGGPGNAWGIPADEYAVPGGSRVEFSSYGRSLVWMPNRTGTVLGAIRGYWDSKGALASAIGFPTITEVPEARSGVSQTFDNARVWWSAATGAHETHGAIRDFYETAAGPASFIGFPTSDELASSGGASQVFAGARVWWSATTSAQETHAGIRSVYEQRGGPGSRLGYPTTNELRSADATTAYQLFQGGRIDFPLNGGPPTVTYS